jgi:hypothetical protein
MKGGDMLQKVRIAGGNLGGTIVDGVPGPQALGAGFNPLTHNRFPGQNLFLDKAIGLNFEHILNGTARDKAINRFTPRLDRCSVNRLGDAAASIVHAAADSAWGIDSEMRYVFSGGDAIDLAFTACPREDRFPLGYVAFMWASYMNRTRERRIHFYGEIDGEEEWISFGDPTPGGFETGTVSAVGVPNLPYEEGAETLNIVEDARKKFVYPFYYGLVDGDGQLETTDDTMVYIMMFDQRDSIRFAMWNFYRDEAGQPDAHSPAWDWQFVIRNPVVGQQYGYRARVVYKPFAGREDVAGEYRRWCAQLASEEKEA